MKDELRNAISSFLILNSSFLGLALLALATLAVGPRPAQAAVTEAWVHRYSNVVSNSYDWVAKMVRDAAGDIVVTGRSGSDMLTLKYSGANGSVLWQSRYNRAANNGVTAAVKAVAVDSSGNVVVTGQSQNERGADYYTAKYAALDGALVWEKRYNGPANSHDFANALAVDNNGNVVVTGYSNNGTNSDYYTAKYAAADGALLWERRYNGPANGDDLANAVAVDGNGNVVVTGYSSIGTNTDYYTARYGAAEGALLWEKRYNGLADADDQAHAVAIDGSGNVVVTGFSSGEDGFRDYYTAKYAAANGALMWEKRYNGGENSHDEVQAAAVDGSGNVVVTGISKSDFYTAKYSSTNGNLLWEKRYNGPANGYDAAWAVAVDDRGNVVVTGSSNNGSDHYSNDFYTALYAAADGALLWEKRYNGRGVDTDEQWFWFVPYSVAVDSSGNVVVAGSSDNLSGSSFDYYTAKYAAADGALLWEQRFNGGAVNYDDLAQAVAVDGSGNVVVTGTSVGTNDNGYMAKYAAVDGALLWEKRHTGPVNQSIAVDGNGNVLLAGGAFSPGTGSWDFYTAKYASSNGALLWEKRYNGPANLGDEAHAVAVDGSGNVVVTGQSASRATPGSGNVHDIYTAKYASADGALLWEKRYNGPADLEDQGHAVTVDAKGDVIVSGVSATSGSPLVGFIVDGYTAKYASGDGALLWEKRYKSPTTYHNSVIALDSDGNVALTGSSYIGGYHTAKFASADGALLWEKRYSGLGYRDDTARAVAVDPQGNVVVTGTSDGGSTGADIYTAKYAGADGALLWEKRYNGPANLDDIAVVVRVDSNGNVVVTGTSAVSGSTTIGFINDYYTAKYAAADGALLWEKRYNGPANRDDYPSSLALGPNGMVVVTGSSAGTGYSAGYAGYDYATVVYREGLPPVAIERVPAGVHLRFAGFPGRTYNIERAPAVTGPWSTINTQTASASGLLEYLDANSPVGAAFYRTSEP